MSNALYLVLVLWPAIASLITLLVDGKSSYRIALLSMLLELTLITYALGNTYSMNAGLLPSLTGSLRGLSGLLALLSVFTLIQALLVARYNGEKKSYALIIAMASGLIGFFSARDLVWLLIFWESTLLILFYMAYSVGANARKASIVYLIYTQIAGTLLLAGVMITYSKTGLTSLSSFSLLPSNAKVLVALLMGLAFWIKTPLFPLHSWLPPLYTATPPYVAISSIIMVKMGAYGFIILYNYSLIGNTPLLALLALAGGIYAVIASYRGNGDYKMLAAYLSIAHMSLTVTPLLVGSTPYSVKATALQIIAHTLAMTSLFSGIAVTTSTGKEIVVDARWWLFLSLISVLPLPGLSTFAGEVSIAYSVYSTSGLPMLLLVVIISLLTLGVVGWTAFRTTALRLETSKKNMLFAGTALLLALLVSIAVGVQPHLVQEQAYLG